MIDRAGYSKTDVDFVVTRPDDGKQFIIDSRTCRIDSDGNLRDDDRHLVRNWAKTLLRYHDLDDIEIWIDGVRSAETV